MEKLSKIFGYFSWMRALDRRHVDEKNQILSDKNDKKKDLQTAKKIISIFESILLWENSVNSISVVVIFNILFWSIVVLEVRGFAAASSAALVVVLCYSTLEAQVEREHRQSPDSTASPPKAEYIGKIIDKAKIVFGNLKDIRRNNPGAFCVGVCTVSFVLWFIGRAVNGVLLTYAICMSILVGPALLRRVPCRVFSTTKEWDNEIEEFLPAVTEDNLEVLARAGDLGDHSPTPSTSSDQQIDPLNDDELIGLKMPSHEDGSTDGLELFELELSTTDVDGLKIQSAHFEGAGSSSEEELELKSKDLSSQSDESESEFEIIDSHEVGNFGNA